MIHNNITIVSSYSVSHHFVIILLYFSFERDDLCGRDTWRGERARAGVEVVDETRLPRMEVLESPDLVLLGRFS